METGKKTDDGNALKSHVVILDENEIFNLSLTLFFYFIFLIIIIFFSSDTITVLCVCWTLYILLMRCFDALPLICVAKLCTFSLIKSYLEISVECSDSVRCTFLLVVFQFGRHFGSQFRCSWDERRRNETDPETATWKNWNVPESRT